MYTRVPLVCSPKTVAHQKSRPTAPKPFPLKPTPTNPNPKHKQGKTAVFRLPKPTRWAPSPLSPVPSGEWLRWRLCPWGLKGYALSFSFWVRLWFMWCVLWCVYVCGDDACGGVGGVVGLMKVRACRFGAPILQNLPNQPTRK